MIAITEKKHIWPTYLKRVGSTAVLVRAEVLRVDLHIGLHAAAFAGAAAGAE